MAVRIQLASNFQVIELTYDSLDIVTMDELKVATEIVNQLGKNVINDIKTAPKAQEKKQEMITDKQKEFLIGKFGKTEKEISKLTKKEAWNLINELRDAF